MSSHLYQPKVTVHTSRFASNDIDREMQEVQARKDKRIEVLKSNPDASCASCAKAKHTTNYGTELRCSAKKKNVKYYNYCEQYTALVFSEK